MYVYIYIDVCMYVCIYIYIHQQSATPAKQSNDLATYYPEHYLHDKLIQASLPICWGGLDRQTQCLLDTIATCRQGPQERVLFFPTPSMVEKGWKRLKKAQMSLLSCSLWSLSPNINTFNTMVFVSHQSSISKPCEVLQFPEPCAADAQWLGSSATISTQASAGYLSWGFCEYK